MIGYALLAISVFAIDIISKKWALVNCIDGCVFNRFISFQVIFNRGMVWSLFHSAFNLQFFLITALVIAVLIFLAVYSAKRYALSIPIYGEILVLSGGFANVIDRFIYGGVVDFIILGYNGYLWPVFNFADIAIFFGVLIMLIPVLRKKV